MTQAQALSILKTGATIFLTGEPGAGKTHTINEYIHYLRASGIEPAITASTGIAATHIGGMTIHSWSGIGIKTTLTKYDLDKIATTEYITKRILRTKVLIIEEVSMLSPNMLTLVDMVCREVKQNQEAFGGMQVIFVGDFFQLPPIVKQSYDETNHQDSFFDEPPARFAYDAPVWLRMSPLVCYLTEQHRQDDDTFLEILSAIRRDTFDEDHFAHIEKRKIERSQISKDTTKLYTHNADVDRVNNTMLSTLTEKPETFYMNAQGKDTLVAALVKGCLSPEVLILKIGAEVMFTKNNPKEGYANGTLGTVVGFEGGTNYPLVKLRNGRQVRVEPMDWNIEENGKIRASVTQLPLRLAWAITVHKSQGMSLDEATMDLSDVFEYGQGYVALSRVRRLSGLFILGWNERAFKVHPEVLERDSVFRQLSSQAEIAFSKLSSKELKKMHDNFVLACGGTIVKGAISKVRTPKPVGGGDTLLETLALWKKGKTVSAIAKARDLKETTIFDHIEKLAESGHITKKEAMRLIPKKLSEALSKIQKVFISLDTTKLTPVYEKLNGEYSYDELRTVRLLLSFKK